MFFGHSRAGGQSIEDECDNREDSVNAGRRDSEGAVVIRNSAITNVLRHLPGF